MHSPIMRKATNLEMQVPLLDNGREYVELCDLVTVPLTARRIGTVEGDAAAPLLELPDDALMLIISAYLADDWVYDNAVLQVYCAWALSDVGSMPIFALDLSCRRLNVVLGKCTNAFKLRVGRAVFAMKAAVSNEWCVTLGRDNVGPFQLEGHEDTRLLTRTIRKDIKGMTVWRRALEVRLVAALAKNRPPKNIICRLTCYVKKWGPWLLLFTAVCLIVKIVAASLGGEQPPRAQILQALGDRILPGYLLAFIMLSLIVERCTVRLLIRQLRAADLELQIPTRQFGTCVTAGLTAYIAFNASNLTPEELATANGERQKLYDYLTVNDGGLNTAEHSSAIESLRAQWGRYTTLRSVAIAILCKVLANMETLGGHEDIGEYATLRQNLWAGWHSTAVRAECVTLSGHLDLARNSSTVETALTEQIKSWVRTSKADDMRPLAPFMSTLVGLPLSDGCLHGAQGREA